jgi:hypothetical protein
MWYEQNFGHPISAIESIEDAVSRWPETATSVAVRLLADDTLTFIAPLGLDDLVGMILRRNPEQVAHDHFIRRLREKRIKETWPRVTILKER